MDLHFKQDRDNNTDPTSDKRVKVDGWMDGCIILQSLNHPQTGRKLRTSCLTQLTNTQNKALFFLPTPQEESLGTGWSYYVSHRREQQWRDMKPRQSAPAWAWSQALPCCLLHSESFVCFASLGLLRTHPALPWGDFYHAFGKVSSFSGLT